MGQTPTSDQVNEAFSRYAVQVALGPNGAPGPARDAFTALMAAWLDGRRPRHAVQVTCAQIFWRVSDGPASYRLNAIGPMAAALTELEPIALAAFFGEGKAVVELRIDAGGVHVTSG